MQIRRVVYLETHISDTKMPQMSLAHSSILSYAKITLFKVKRPK